MSRCPYHQMLTGKGGETHPAPDANAPALTTQQGIIVSDNQNTLKAHPSGPALLEDFVLREKIMHFDHERIPERVVHARGTAAHGVFKLSKSLKGYTTAKILTEVGVETPLFTRFSTVAGGAGSVDTPRDVRGFAVKFYTSEGNWDLVGNNIPVFFIQDAIKFPDLIHAAKMEPDRGFPQAATAHDTFWDFISLMPESMHMVMWAMSDRTLPRSLRMMEGFGVHTFRLINAEGKSTFVKFHWRPKLGLQSTVWDEALKLQFADNDFHRRDLFESIQNGDYPEWDLAVQLFTQEEADQFPFDHLDSTKLIPEELVPLQVIGTMTLNRWPDNFFAETEQVAYCVSNVVPGIDFTNDPLLQGRLFSYLDTQLSRLGSPNFAQLPINAPRCPVMNNQRDGHMQMQVPKGRVAYEPQSLEAGRPIESAKGFRSFAELMIEREQGRDNPAKGRIRPESFADHFSQARQFYLSQTPIEQAHIASALVFELSKVETEHIHMGILSHLQNIDMDLAKRVATGLGHDKLPEKSNPTAPIQDMPPSPPLQIIGKMKETLKGRCVGILVSEGSNADTLAQYKNALKAEGASFKVVAPKIHVTLSDGSKLKVDGQLAGTPSILFDAVVSILMPDEGKKLTKDSAAVDWFANAFVHLKAIAACKGTQPLLDKANVEKDAGIVAVEDVSEFIKQAKTRQWDREPKVRDLA